MKYRVCVGTTNCAGGLDKSLGYKGSNSTSAYAVSMGLIMWAASLLTIVPFQSCVFDDHQENRNHRNTQSYVQNKLVIGYDVRRKFL